MHIGQKWRERERVQNGCNGVERRGRRWERKGTSGFMWRKMTEEEKIVGPEGETEEV